MRIEKIEINPSSAGDPVGTVIWLHGLGASGHDFAPVVPEMGLPKVRFVFPHAPQMPVTINGGMVMPAWYDILTLDRPSPLEIAANRPDLIREPEASVREGARYVEAVVAEEIERGTPAGSIVLAGFSQGGAMALHVGLRYPLALRGIMVLSAYMVLPHTIADEAHEANSRAPMLFCHGSQDPMVPRMGGHHAYEAVRDKHPERSIEWHEYSMGHEVCPEELGLIARWLQDRFVEGA